MIVDPNPGKVLKSPNRFDSIAPGLAVGLTKEQKSKAEYERPTSGKHFSRLKVEDTSDLTKNYDKSKRVDVLMKKLAEYMALTGDDIDLSKIDVNSTFQPSHAETELPEKKIKKTRQPSSKSTINQNQFKLKKQI